MKEFIGIDLFSTNVAKSPRSYVLEKKSETNNYASCGKYLVRTSLKVLSFTQNRFWRALNITAGLSRIFEAAYSIESVIFDAEKMKKEAPTLYRSSP